LCLVTKKSQGEVIRVQRITERDTVTAKNYGIYFRYRNRTGQINAFKEFRAPSLEAAISELHTEMGSRQKVTKESISIIRIVSMKWGEMKVRGQRALRFRNTTGMKIAHWRKRVRAESKQYRSQFSARRPTTFKTDKTISK